MATVNGEVRSIREIETEVNELHEIAWAAKHKLRGDWVQYTADFCLAKNGMIVYFEGRVLLLDNEGLQYLRDRVQLLQDEVSAQGNKNAMEAVRKRYAELMQKMMQSVDGIGLSFNKGAGEGDLTIDVKMLGEQVLQYAACIWKHVEIPIGQGPDLITITIPYDADGWGMLLDAINCAEDDLRAKKTAN